MSIDKLDHMRLGVPYIEHCKECAGEIVTVWSKSGSEITQNHSKGCSVLAALRKRYQIT